MQWSIVVCTYNRSRNLSETLRGLGSLEYPRGEYEVIVVDNGSTDDTASVVGAFKASMVSVSYFRENRQGLSHARNRGLEAAAGLFVAFIDDDARPDKHWLLELEKGFNDPSVACVGGAVRPVFTTRSAWPEWLPDRLKCFYTVIDYGARRALHYPDYPAGTNISFRKSIFREVGLFDPGLGRTGDQLLSMEETDLCLRIEKKGYSILFMPDATVHHNVHEERLTRIWLMSRCRAQGISAALIEKNRVSMSVLLMKSLKYLLFIPAGAVGQLLFQLGGNETLSLFCRCQTILCISYLKQLIK